MPLWSRSPKGVYARPSTEWYANQRGRCSILNGFPNDGGPLIYALYNNGSPSVYLHVIGVVLQMFGEGEEPVYGRFYTGGAPNQDHISSPATISPTAPIYSNQPMPPGVGQLGSDPTATFADALVIPTSLNPTVFYPTREIAVIAPNDVLGLYYGSGAGTFLVMFEWYWAVD